MFLEILFKPFQRIQLCSNMVVRDVVTSNRLYPPGIKVRVELLSLRMYISVYVCVHCNVRVERRNIIVMYVNICEYVYTRCSSIFHCISNCIVISVIFILIYFYYMKECFTYSITISHCLYLFYT